MRAFLAGRLHNDGNTEIHGSSRVTTMENDDLRGALRIIGNEQFGDASLTIDTATTSKSYTELNSQDGEFAATLTAPASKAANRLRMHSSLETPRVAANAGNFCHING